MPNTLKQHLRAAKEEWEARQRFLKSGAAIHEIGDIGLTYCGLHYYQWEEDPWEVTPLADDPSEITCKKCLAAMKKESS